MQFPERGADGAEMSTTMKEVQETMGNNIKITLVLPDGREVTHEFPAGQSIGYVKAVIHTEYGFAVAATTLSLNGTTLIDPMSICDYPQINAAEGATFTVTVKE